MHPTIRTGLGLGLAVISGLFDLATPMIGGPPAGVAIAAVVLGLLTLSGVALAIRGRRVGVPLVLFTRLMDGLAAVPAFFSGDAGAAQRWPAGAVVGLAAVVIVLLTIGPRTARA